MRHGVCNQAQVARIHRNAVGAKHCAHFSQQRGARSLHPVVLQHGEHVVAADAGAVERAIRAGCVGGPEVDAVGLHAPQGGLLVLDDVASLLQVSPGCVTIVATDRSVMTNARPVIEHFDSDGGTTHTVVREPKRIKEVKNNTDEVDERNPFGRPDQGITDYDDLINPPAAAASAAQPAAASASDQDHAQDNAQDDDVNDKEDRDPNMSDIPNDVW